MGWARAEERALFMSAPQPQPTRRHGFNIVGRVRELATRAEWAETFTERQGSANALAAIHRILKDEGLDSA
jgi:hypothetical protein